MGLFSNGTKFRGQSYSKIKKEFMKKQEKFTDPIFPPTDSSLFFSKQPPAVITWKRPHEIVDNPKLVVEGVTASDVTQGHLGNCWFVAACATLAGVKELWQKVIPDHKEQEFKGDFHPGVFHFRFWRFGEWVDVVVDDLLPTIDGQLIFTHSRQRGEFWCPFLEKAYAKLYGSYEALEGGNLSDALVDLTSGVSAHLDLTIGGYVDDFDKKSELFKMMLKEMEDKALMCCAIATGETFPQPHNHNEMEMRTDVGLVKGHAYGITAVKKINIGESGLFSLFKGKNKLKMIRLKNPWGEKEWTGSFSDGSPEWSQVTNAEKERLGLTFEDDGEFWMMFDDFLEHFTDLSICFLKNTKIFSFSKTWHESSISGQWSISNDRAGGCTNNKDTCLNNPQYRFDIHNEVDEVIFQLLQRDKRDSRQIGEYHLVIGFFIMKVEVNRIYRVHKSHESAATSDYIKTRSIFLREQLGRGRYVIVPSTFKPNEEGEFLLRVFSSKNPKLKELTKDHPTVPWYLCCMRSPQIVTAVKLVSAVGLERQNPISEWKRQLMSKKVSDISSQKPQVKEFVSPRPVKGAPNPYCVIKCEGENIRSSVEKATTEPKWNTSAIFYRKNVDQPIIIEVWNSGIVDSFVGRAELLAPVNPNKIQVELPLYGRGKERHDERSGSVTVHVYCDEDLDSV